MAKVFRYIWQLPQNIVGLLVIAFSKAHYNETYIIWETDMQFGVSLGEYIIINKRHDIKSVLHEMGHQQQSMYLGWLYLIIIGLPSAIGNLIDRWFHKKWTLERRIKWYYSLPWEAWADKLGGVVR